jgi:hypothetical protein
MCRQTNRFKPLLAIAAVIGLALLCGTDEPSQEYKVKAVFIYNLVQFVDWPDKVFASADAPFVVAGHWEKLLRWDSRASRRRQTRDFHRLVSYETGALVYCLISQTLGALELRTKRVIGRHYVLFHFNDGPLQFPRSLQLAYTG